MATAGGHTGGGGHRCFAQQVASWLQPADLPVFDHPLLRLIVAGVAISTTKALFAAGLHYPYHLLVIHLLATSLFDVYRRLYSNVDDRENDGSVSIVLEPGKRLVQASLLVLYCLHGACIAGSLACEYQAIYHFTNTPALTMLFALDWIRCPQTIEFLKHAQAAKAGLAFVSLVSIAMICLFEHKLSVPGLKSALVSFFLSALARSVDELAKRWSGVSQPFDGAKWYARLPILLLALILGVVGVQTHERPVYTPVEVPSLCGTIVWNLLAAVNTLRDSWSLFRPAKRSRELPCADIAYDDEVQSLLSPLILVGLVTTGTALTGPWEALSVWQYIGFVAALASAFAAGHMLRTGSIHGSRQPHDSIPLLSSAATRIHTARSVESSPKDWTLELEPEPSEPHTTPWILFSVLGLLLSNLPISLYFTLCMAPQQWLTQQARILTPPNSTSFDFVVSRYQESVGDISNQLGPLLKLSAIQDRTIRVVVYDAGEASDTTFSDELRLSLSPDLDVTVERRANVGREGAAYLQHMCDRWDSLADQTMFMQAHLHDFAHVPRRLETYLLPETGFLSLSELAKQCSDCGACWDHSTWSEGEGTIRDLYSRAFAGADCEPFTYTYRGQFVASRKRIHHQGRELFQRLLDELVNANSEKHGAEYIGQPWMPQRSDSMNDPLFGYTLERTWGLLMRCADVRLAHTCPSMMAASVASAFGTRSGSLDACQCIDK